MLQEQVQPRSIVVKRVRKVAVVAGSSPAGDRFLFVFVVSCFQIYNLVPVVTNLPKILRNSFKTHF